MTPLRSTPSILLIGALAFFVLGGSWMVFDIAVGGGLARASGDLGVAVRWTLFDPAVLLCLGAGAFCMFAGVGGFLHNLITSKKSA
jgi:hypothetical protein